jgi:hypothetical protein
MQYFGAHPDAGQPDQSLTESTKGFDRSSHLGNFRVFNVMFYEKNQEVGST